MIKKIFLLVAVVFACGAGTAAEYALSFKKGFLFVPAGTGWLSTQTTNLLGRTVQARTLAFKAASLVDAVYHLDTRLTSYLLDDGRPLAYEKHAEEGARVYSEASAFVHAPTGGCTVVSRRTVRGGAVERARNTRPGPVFDLLSVCEYARARVASETPKKGWKIPVSVVSGVKVRDCELVYEGDETEKTDKGEKISCRVFSLEVGTGDDKRGSAKFWIGQAAPQPIVLIELALKFGCIRVRLVDAR